VFKLDCVRYLLELLGNPQDQLKIIHVAGSKGKGSTCALTASVLRAAGYKVGLYTSPHLNDYRERIRVLDPSLSGDGNDENIFPDMISEQELCAVLEAIKPCIARLQKETALGELSFFEVFTALAFYYFRYKQVDWVVLEAGMGGRLDATNVAPSQICVITPISLEHTQYLGDTIAKIAGEKAAIVKDPLARVVIAPQEPAARDVLEKRCAEFSIRPIWIGRGIRYKVLHVGTGPDLSLRNRLHQDLPAGRVGPATRDRQVVRIQRTKQHYIDFELSLLGRHQAINAAVVFGIVETLRDMDYVVSQEAVYAGLRDTFWPGRLEVIGQDPVVILDCAHNQASAMHLVESLRRIFPNRSVTLILGVSQDKDKTGICRELDSITQTVIAAKADHPRAHWFTDDELKHFFPGKPFVRIAGIGPAIEAAYRGAAPENIILIAGSVFLVSEARRYLVNKKGATSKGQGSRFFSCSLPHAP
jgi:dihydrofolate synthase/folylpolyglutamate synthase